LGFKPGIFLKAYEANRADATSIVLEDQVAQAILKFASACISWEGTSGELLTILTADIPNNDKTFPKSPVSFANLLRRLAPSLRTVHVDLEFGKRREPKTGRRLISIALCAAHAER
jgi:hypothetical protein